VNEDWRIRKVEQSGPVSHMLVFDEGVAVDREDLVSEAVKFLESFPGVTEVDHAEREIVEIAAHAVPDPRLTEALQRWWEAAKREKRPWQAAVDRAAGIVADLAAGDGFQRDGWELTRRVDAELTHGITLDHRFGWMDGGRQQLLTVTAGVRLALPDRRHQFWVVRYEGELNAEDAEAQLVEAITGRVLPILNALSSVDEMLDLWREERSIEEGGRQPYHMGEAPLHAQVLVSRGRLVEAGRVYQQDFDRDQPRARQYLLEQIAAQGVPLPTTGTNPHLSVAEEATLAQWQANTASRVDRLREVTGLPLDCSRESVDELWAWLRVSRDRLQAAFADATPVFDRSYYGVHTGSDIYSGRLPFDSWYRATVELVTAYLGQVVIGLAPGTEWGIGHDGELAMVRNGGTGLLWRVFTFIHQAFDAPVDEFDPRRLRRLADDMVRWVNDGQYAPWIVRLGVPGP
jgi:hypothetical protein